MLIAIMCAIAMACDTTDTSDYYGPRVISVTPPGGSTAISTGTTLSVIFNEFVEDSTVTTATFLVQHISANISNTAGSISHGGNIITFDPTNALEPESVYMATLTTEITDMQGNPMTTPYTWYFSTGADASVLGIFEAAQTVIGQAGFTTATAGTTAATLTSPAGNAFVNGSTLYLPDTANNRVLGFYNIPVAGGAMANFVIGQADMTSSVAGNSPSALNSPGAILIADGRTIITDTGNNRVLIYNSVALSNQPSAYVAIGQPGLDTNASGCSAYRLNSPSGAAMAGDRLIVADTGNNRVLIYNGVPAISNAPADMALGQTALDSCAMASITNASTLTAPSGAWSDGSRLAVADTGNNRVLIWRDFPTISGAMANSVLGQPDMYSTASYVSAVDMNGPTALSVSPANMLFVADTGNNRVLIWSSYPQYSYEQADAVLGQGAFYLNQPNDSDANGATDTPSAQTLSSPTGVFAYNATALIVTDTGNNRVLIYNAP